MRNTAAPSNTPARIGRTRTILAKKLTFALLPFSVWVGTWGVPQGACCTSWLLVVLTDWGAGLAACLAGFYAHRPAEQECAVFTFHCAQDKLSPRCVGCGDWWVCVCLVGTLCILVTDAGVWRAGFAGGRVPRSLRRHEFCHLTPSLHFDRYDRLRTAVWQRRGPVFRGG